MTRADHYTGPTPRAFALSTDHQVQRIRAERDIARNERDAALAEAARLRAELAARDRTTAWVPVWQPSPKPDPEETP